MKVWLFLVLGLLLAGCAAMVTPPPFEPLLHDDLFGRPPRPAGADQVLALDDTMRDYLRSALDGGAARRKGRPRALVDALYARGELRLDYDASVTRNAAQAFKARAGNCLSLVIMTAAFAQELGLEVSYQSAQLDQAFSRQGGLTLRSGHVNLVLGPRHNAWGWRTLTEGEDPDRLQVDFLPPEELKGLRTMRISEATVLAMFMNNRATEALLQQRTGEAYAWAREALQRDPGFWAAYNTLGVIYQRAGHLAPAAAAFEHALAHDDRQVAAMWNLAQVLQAQGRSDEAQRWTARRLALEPQAPFQALQQGQAAMAGGAYGQARELFLREQRLTGVSSELSFWLAQAHYRLGEAAQAQRALQQAMDLSPDAGQQARYAGKLAWLREQARP